MKRLALVLAALNLAVLAWFLVRPPGAPAPAGVAPAGEPLVMLAEIPQAQLSPRAALAQGALPAGVMGPSDNESSADEPAPPQVAQVSDCYRVIGFGDEKSALRGKSVLEKAGAKVGGPAPELTQRTRFWVLLPPFASQAQARSVIDRLRKAGVTDYYLIPSGENRNALSLGVFSTREGARRRMNDVASLRLKVRVEEVKFPARRFFLDLEWMGSSKSGWQDLLPPGVEARVRECDA